MGVQRLRKIINTIKVTLPPRYKVVEFYVWTNSKDLEKNKNLEGFPSNLEKRSKRWSQTTGMCLVRMDSTSLYGDFNYRLTQVTIHPYDSNQLVMSLMSLRLL